MNRFRLGVSLVVAAAALAACGGGSNTGSSTATPAAADSRSTALGKMTAPVAASVDPRLTAAKGKVDVWVQLDVSSVARARALLNKGQPGRARALGSAAGEGSAMAAAMVAQRASVMAQQAATADRLSALGAKELGRVQVAHNAIAVTIDASLLPELAKLPGVARVRPVIHYEKHLGETVPYVGGSAVQASGKDGTGVRVAVLDSGIDYTHKNLGGSGSAADYAAATAIPAAIPGRPVPHRQGGRRLRLHRLCLAERSAHRRPEPDRRWARRWPRHARGGHHRGQEPGRYAQGHGTGCRALRGQGLFERQHQLQRHRPAEGHGLRARPRTATRPPTTPSMSSTCRWAAVTARSKTT